MIIFLRHTEIDKEKWDKAIQESQQELIYAFSWYLDILAPEWCALVKDDYSAVMPLPLRRKMGMEYVFQPLYAQQLGVFSREKMSIELLKDFLERIPEKIKYIDTNLNISNPVKGLSYQWIKRTNYELHLNECQEDILKSYSSNTSRNLKKSKALISVEENIPVKELIRLKRENTLPSRPVKFYEWLSVFVEQLLSRNHGKIVGAKVNGELVSAALFAIDRNRIYYLIPVSNNEGKELRAMFAVIDSVITSYAGTGKILDFEGSDIKGIARFFAGFGAKPVNYYKLKINRLPLFLRIFKK